MAVQWFRSSVVRGSVPARWNSGEAGGAPGVACSAAGVDAWKLLVAVSDGRRMKMTTWHDIIGHNFKCGSWPRGIF